MPVFSPGRGGLGTPMGLERGRGIGSSVSFASGARKSVRGSLGRGVYVRGGASFEGADVDVDEAVVCWLLLGFGGVVA